jgi:hypothetical protein
VPEVVPACVGLVGAAPCGPVKPVVNGVAVVAGRLNRRRTSPMVSPIRRRGLGAGAWVVFCGSVAFSELFVLSGRSGCPQVAGPFFRFVSHDREECQGEHGEGDMPVPGVVEADLVVVQPGVPRDLLRPELSRL